MNYTVVAVLGGRSHSRSRSTQFFPPFRIFIYLMSIVTIMSQKIIEKSPNIIEMLTKVICNLKSPPC